MGHKRYNQLWTPAGQPPHGGPNRPQPLGVERCFLRCPPVFGHRIAARWVPHLPPDPPGGPAGLRPDRGAQPGRRVRRRRTTGEFEQPQPDGLFEIGGLDTAGDGFRGGLCGQ